MLTRCWKFAFTQKGLGDPKVGARVSYVFSAALKRLAFETAVLSCSAVCAHFLSPLLNSFAFGFQGCTDDIQRLITEVAGLPCGEVKAEYVSQDAATDDERYAGDSMCACVRHRLLALYSLSVSYGLHHHPFVLISQPLLSAGLRLMLGKSPLTDQPGISLPYYPFSEGGQRLIEGVSCARARAGCTCECLQAGHGGAGNECA